TRFSRDWSSDVCSSDLEVLNRDLVQTRSRLDDLAGGVVSAVNTIHRQGWSPATEPSPPEPVGWAGSNVDFFTGTDAATIAVSAKIGRASCRGPALRPEV